MPSIYEFELQSYRKQIQLMRSEIENIDWDNIENLTHFGLARSNRSNFLVVGLCGLVEAKLFDIAEHQEHFDLEKINSKGLSGLVDYLKELEALQFNKLDYWDPFYSIYQIRNAIVHSYGGLITKQNPSKIKNHFSKLGLTKYLVADIRIRLAPDALDQITDTVENLILELNQHAT